MALTIKYIGEERAPIFVAPGFDIASPADYGRHNKPAFMYAAHYPEVAPDGSMIWFKREEPFGGAWVVYSVADGDLREVDAGYIWELRDLMFDGQSLPLWKSVASARR
jgi:hypothetical protein